MTTRSGEGARIIARMEALAVEFEQPAAVGYRQASNIPAGYAHKPTWGPDVARRIREVLDELSATADIPIQEHADD